MDERLKQTIMIKDKSSLVADGVIEVESFAPDYMIINTKYGKLNIEGEGLKINELLREEGKISVSGDISGVFFKEESEYKSIFKRVFK